MDNKTINISDKRKNEKYDFAIIKGLKKIGSVLFSFFTYGLVAIVLALLLSYFIGGGDSIRVMGYSSFFIETGSMEAVMPAGTLVFTKENPQGIYKVGEDISFFASNVNGKVVTHRIVEVGEDEDGYRFYVTKGTNNPDNDIDPVYAQNIIGKVVYKVPEVGIYVDYIKENLVVSVVFIVSSALIISFLIKEFKQMVIPKNKGSQIEENENLTDKLDKEEKVKKQVEVKDENKHSSKIKRKRALMKNRRQRSKNLNLSHERFKSYNSNFDDKNICVLNIVMENLTGLNGINDSLFELMVVTSEKTDRLILKDKEKIAINIKANDSYTIMFKNNLEALGYDVDILNDHGVSVAGNVINVMIRVKQKSRIENPQNGTITTEDLKVNQVEKPKISKTTESTINKFEKNGEEGKVGTVEDNVHFDLNKYEQGKVSINGDKLDSLIYELNNHDPLSVITVDSDIEGYKNKEIKKSVNGILKKKESLNNNKNFNNTLTQKNMPKHALDYISIKLIIRHVFDTNNSNNDNVITYFKVYNINDLTKSFKVSIKGDGYIETEILKFYEPGIYSYNIACLEHRLLKYDCDHSLFTLRVEIITENGELKIKSKKYTCSNKSGLFEIPTFITTVL